MNNLRFTEEDVNHASDGWNFNCGPAAICSVLNLMPCELRPKLGEFEEKGYTNPTLMKDTLARLGKKFRQTYRADGPFGMPRLKNGVMRVQWSGPWTKPGVPMRVRYRKTHWVGMRNEGAEIFDINAMRVGGWISFSDWTLKLIPWLIKQCCPDGDGDWWPTHALEIE